jgi:hypothetical protein
VLSLVAPLVALSWQWLLARAGRAPLEWHHLFVLGASVWLAYALDRWIEGWRLSDARLRTARHAFYKRRRWPVAVLWSALLLADLAVAATRLTSRELQTGFVLLGAVLAYLLSHQWLHRERPWRAPKEACVALLFGGGVVVFAAASDPAVLRALAVPLALFVLLCFANCVLISIWEREVDQAHGQTSLALQGEGWRPGAVALPWALAAVAALLFHQTGGAAIACAAVSGVLLGTVDRLQPRFGRQLARAVADIALMTPLVPLAAEWLR